MRYTAARCGQNRGTEAPRQWQHRARPAFVSPETVVGLPEVRSLNFEFSSMYRNRKIARNLRFRKSAQISCIFHRISQPPKYRKKFRETLTWGNSQVVTGPRS